MASKSRTVSTGVGNFRVIIPPDLRVDRIYAIMREELEKYGKLALVKDGESTTRNWQRTKPTWITVVKVTGAEMTLTLKLRGDKKTLDIWGYVDKGTKPHNIFPKKPGGRLRFQGGKYNAGSHPGSLVTARSQATGPTVYRFGVRHPGFPARKWSELIKKNNEKPFRSWMDAALSKAARESGHYYEGK